MTDSLENWRRTHYSNEVKKELKGEKVLLMGWIHEMRDLGGIIFVLLRDRDGIIQITVPSKKVSPELFEEIKKLKKEAVIAVKGDVQESPKAPNGVEIIPEEIKLLNEIKLHGRI